MAYYSYVDIAPTILHLLDLPIPKDMDGKVLKEIFKSGSDPSEREIKYQPSLKEDKKKERFTSKTDEEMKERLRRLGYF